MRSCSASKSRKRNGSEIMLSLPVEVVVVVVILVSVEKLMLEGLVGSSTPVLTVRVATKSQCFVCCILTDTMKAHVNHNTRECTHFPHCTKTAFLETSASLTTALIPRSRLAAPGAVSF